MIPTALTKRVQRILKRLYLGRPVESGMLQTVRCRVLDTDVTFCVNMENDPIQRNHRRGTFYEIKELREIIPIFPKGGVFVDIGANVGNHALFAALHFKAGKVIPFEPNPQAYDLLIQNVLANGLQDTFDLTKLGVGISASHEGGFAMQKRTRNLGAAKMLPGQGDLEVYPGDMLLEGVVPDMIKIDVEGMEMDALAGLSKTLKKHRPMLMIEVDNENENEFLKWANANKYAVLKMYQRYRLNKNYLLVDAKKIKKIEAVFSKEKDEKTES